MILTQRVGSRGVTAIRGTQLQPCGLREQRSLFCSGVRGEKRSTSVVVV